MMKYIWSDRVRGALQIDRIQSRFQQDLEPCRKTMHNIILRIYYHQKMDIVGEFTHVELLTSEAHRKYTYSQ